MDPILMTQLQITWGTLSLPLGLLSNVFVLYATIAHNAIRLDRVSVWIINNLAVVDIVNSLIVLLPNLLTQYYDGRWIFGRGSCYVYSCFRLSFFAANIFLIMVMSLNKLMRCLFPFRNLDSSRLQRIVITFVTVFIGLIPSAWNVFGFIDGFYWIDTINHFAGSRNVCKATVLAEKVVKLRKNIVFMLGFILDIIPCVVLVIINSILIIYAIKKTKTTVNKGNLIIVITVTGSMLLSFVPVFVTMVIPRKVSWDVYELAWSVTFSSLWSNPVIYFAVNPTFRDFTTNMVCFWRPRRVTRVSRVSVSRVSVCNVVRSQIRTQRVVDRFQKSSRVGEDRDTELTETS